MAEIADPLMIRILTADDAEECHQLRLRGLREYPFAFGSHLDEEIDLPLERQLQRMASDESRATFGAFVDGVLVGMVGYGRESRMNNRHRGGIWGMFVMPEYHGRGIARKLMERAIEFGFSIPEVQQMNLGVADINVPARTLYESLGFKAFGIETACLIVNGEPVNEVHMVLVRPEIN